MADLAVRIMSEARDRAGKAQALVTLIAPLVGRLYDDSAVSAWVTGRGMPPASVLLAAAKVTGIRLDEFLSQESLLARFTRLEEKVEELGRRPVAEVTDS